MDFSNFQKSKNEEIIKKHILNGVKIVDPSNTYIDEEVKIGEGTILLPGVILQGNTSIGENCQVGPFSTIENTKIGNNTVFKNSVAMDASIGDDTTVGPFAYIRPQSDIKNHVKSW